MKNQNRYDKCSNICVFIILNHVSVIEIASGEYGFDLINRMVASVEIKSPILPIYRSRQELELERKNPRVIWFDQFSTLVKRMMTQCYRTRVRSSGFITFCQ